MVSAPRGRYSSYCILLSWCEYTVNVLSVILGQSHRGSTVYVGMDTKTGQLVTITEWTLKWRHAHRKLDVDERTQEEKDAAKYMKQVRRHSLHPILITAQFTPFEEYFC